MQAKNMIAALLALAASSVAVADAWPSQSIHLIVPYAPGGGNDVISRLVARQLEGKLKVPVLVDNKGGANGSIGVVMLKQAKPDGYTLATIPSGPLDVNPFLMKGITYDPAKDFTYIGPMVKFPLFLAVAPNSGVKTVAQLIAKAKAEPGKVTYSSAGIGNSTHLAGALLAHATGTQMTHVAYRGSGPAAVALMGGEVTFTFGSGPSIMDFVNSGKVVGLGVSEPARLESEKNIPTIAEQGVPGFEASSWAGIVGPAGLPNAVADKLTQSLREVMEDPEFRKVVFARGMVPISGNGKEFETMVQKDARKWSRLITEAGIKAE
ncbi:tripartite tricarboxylate transporter substrate binding protein [Ramlibacter sp.]|uniref:Bug family tripartite tricarboxylate transporter substrate binding protein n=1 Tax=Ramlibacter sp. TaxID=1917967 RepID=UPI00261A780E|nr:tripartite tricarboxylate transporter substrate binding protein [Ramlibacter sp.]MDB5955883.1 transporter substrate-binding protein [Ramlibacter sp.]